MHREFYVKCWEEWKEETNFYYLFLRLIAKKLSELLWVFHINLRICKISKISSMNTYFRENFDWRTKKVPYCFPVKNGNICGQYCKFFINHSFFGKFWPKKKKGLNHFSAKINFIIDKWLPKIFETFLKNMTKYQLFF
jgi:hypothetical protein